MSEPLLRIEQVSKSFGHTRVLEDLTFEIQDGELLTLLGESGSGKTTLLRILAGFERADCGSVIMRGERIDRLPPQRRPFNTVFQQYALFPHLNVFENVAYGLRTKKVASGEVTERVMASLEQVRMTGMEKRRPSQLSGGQQQRVALARALVNRPSLLLLDEPLSALDASLRGQMQAEIKRLQRETGITFVFVTHDQEEAMALSDRIAVLRKGCLVQVATPRELYRRPSNAYVATFIGKANLLPGGMAIRPEHLHVIDAAAASGDYCWTGQVKGTLFAGSSEIVSVECAEGLNLEVRVPSGNVYPRHVTLRAHAEDVIRLN